MSFVIDKCNLFESDAVLFESVLNLCAPAYTLRSVALAMSTKWRVLIHQLTVKIELVPDVTRRLLCADLTSLVGPQWCVVY